MAPGEKLNEQPPVAASAGPKPVAVSGAAPWSVHVTVLSLLALMPKLPFGQVPPRQPMHGNGREPDGVTSDDEHAPDAPTTPDISMTMLPK